MERRELIDAHIKQVAEDNQIKPEEVYVFDAEKAPKIKHDFKQYGSRFVCALGHPRHEAWGKPM